MVQILTIEELEDITSINLINESMTVTNKLIVRAQSELELSMNRVLAETDTDISPVKMAVAYLALYFIRRKNKEYDVAQMELNEYYRLYKQIHNDPTPELQRPWQPTMRTITNTDITE